MVPCSVDIPGAHDLPSYYGRDDGRGAPHDGRGAPHGMRVGDSLGASYDRYLHGAVHMVSILLQPYHLICYILVLIY